MDSQYVEKIFWRRVQPGDLFNCEKELTSGPKGQIHIDIAPSEAIESFLSVPPVPDGEAYPVNVRSIGAPGVVEPLQFNQRPARSGGNARWGIPRQNRGTTDPLRPTAWTEPFGWPRFDEPPKSREDAQAKLDDIGGLVIYIVRTTTGELYAGMTRGIDDHENWPDVLDPMIEPGEGKNSGCIVPGLDSIEMTPLALEIMEEFKASKNVLVYGPPGTGKSHAVAEVYRAITEFNGDLRALRLDPNNAVDPFFYDGVEVPIASPARGEWVTFHPEYGYEDFVKGLRPTGQGLQLQTVAGVLLDLALDVSFGPHSAAFLVADEINRGNVPRILGDFITFMDSDYREGGLNPIPTDLPVVRGGVDGEGIATSFDSNLVVEPGWTFPEEVYLLATMNSVDKSVAPIDSAIGRRFTRLDAFANYSHLAKELDVELSVVDALFGGEGGVPSLQLDDSRLESTTEDEDEETWAPDPQVDYDSSGEPETTGSKAESDKHELWNPRVAAISLLIYLNQRIEEILDRDSSLGHTYFIRVQSWSDLANVWDTKLYSQIQDRFSTRPDVIDKILRRRDQGAPGDYPFRPSAKPWIQDSVQNLSALPEHTLARAFRFLVFGR